jgi:hypothetical protein
MIQSTLESGVIIEAKSLVDPHDTPYARLFVRTHFILRLFRLYDWYTNLPSFPLTSPQCSTCSTRPRS